MVEVPWHLPNATFEYRDMHVMCSDQLLFTFNSSQGWHDLYSSSTSERRGGGVFRAPRQRSAALGSGVPRLALRCAQRRSRW